MWVCSPRLLWCLCFDDPTDPYSCDCTPLHEADAVKGHCVRCGAPMILIDVDSWRHLGAKAAQP